MKLFAVFFISFCSVLCGTVCVGQNPDNSPKQQVRRSEQAEQHHSLMMQCLSEGKCWEGISAGEKELAALRLQSDKTDSLQANALVILGVLYNRTNNTEKAIEQAESAKEIMLREKLDTTLQMSVIYDNLALYYVSARRVQKAAEYSAKAVEICNLLGADNYDAGITMSRAADVAYHAERYKDAINFEKQALTIFSNTKGMHSKEYISELEFLAKCQRVFKQEDEAKTAEALAKKLKDENEHGYIPMRADLSTAEQCHIHNEDAFYAARYYRTHYFSADSMQYIANYLFQYSVNSADVHIFVGADEMKWMSHKFGMPYNIAYIAGFINYQLLNPEDEISFEAYKHGMNALLQCYQANRQFSGKVKALEKYISLYQKDKDKYFQKLERSYDAYLKAVEKTRNEQQTAGDGSRTE